MQQLKRTFWKALSCCGWHCWMVTLVICEGHDEDELMSTFDDSVSMEFVICSKLKFKDSSVRNLSQLSQWKNVALINFLIFYSLIIHVWSCNFNMPPKFSDNLSQRLISTNIHRFLRRYTVYQCEAGSLQVKTRKWESCLNWYPQCSPKSIEDLMLKKFTFFQAVSIHLTEH